MEEIYPRFRQRDQPRLHLLRCGRKPRGIILEFPLRKAKTDGKVRADGLAHGANDFRGKSGALSQRLATITIGALIGGVPKELVNQIAMRPMNLHGVKPQCFRICRRLRERPDGFGNIFFRHRHAADCPRCDITRRPLKRSGRQPTGGLGSHHAHVPELRGHDAPNGMHFLDHGLPPSEWLLTIKTGDVRIVGRSRAIDHGALRHDQAHFPFRAAGIVGGHSGRRHTFGRK